VRHGRQLTRAGGAGGRLPDGRRGHPRRRPRLDRPGGRAPRHRGLRAVDDALPHRQQVGHDDRDAGLPGALLGAGAGRPPRDRQPRRGRALRRHRRPRPGPRGGPPQRRVPGRLPQPARHRRPLLRAQLRRPRAGRAARPRPRSAPRRRPADGRGLPCRGRGQPGAGAGHGARRPRPRGARQADLRHRARHRRLRRLGGAARGREHRQERLGDRPRGWRAARGAGRLRPGPHLRAPLARGGRRLACRDRCDPRRPRGRGAPGHRPRHPRG